MRALSLFAFTATAAAQVATNYPDVVLTRLPGNPAAQLLAVDRVAATVAALPRFASDMLPPQAVVIDPYDRALCVALDLGAAGSRLVRLDRSLGQFVEHPLATLPGPVTGLMIAGENLYAAVDAPQGGIYRLPRRGGSAAPTVVMPNVTAMHGYGPGQAVAAVAWTGRPGTAQPLSGAAVIDVDTGQVYQGPLAFANPSGLAITGIADLWTGVPRHVLSFADGTFALVVNLQGPVTPVAVPPVPAGGAVALLHASYVGGDPLALGGSAFPYLYSVDAFGMQIGALSPALPGDPISFESGPTLGAYSTGYGSACGASAMTQSTGGLPQPGNVLTIANQGPANTAVVLVASLDDFAGGALPFPLPGGCSLELSPDATLVLVGGTNGYVAHNLAIPAGPGLLGTILFSQWIALDGTFSTSATLAHWIGL